MTVVADRIETDTQLDYLRELDRTAAQFFRLARRQAAADISTRVGAVAGQQTRPAIVAWKGACRRLSTG